MVKQMVPLHVKSGDEIWYEITDDIKTLIENIDGVKFDSFFKAAQNKQKVSIVNKTIFQEAYYSAVLEGINITEHEAKDLIERRTIKGDSNARSILSSYSAVNFIISNSNRYLDEAAILQLYRIISVNSISPGPPIKDSMDNSVEFFNFYNDFECNPLIKSCIIHYYIVHRNLFPDCSSSLGRMLSVMYLLKSDYKFGKFCSPAKSISQNISVLDCLFSDSSGDITEFIEAMLKVYYIAANEASNKFKSKYGVKVISKAFRENLDGYNRFQIKAINKIATGKIESITISEYQKISNLNYRNARIQLEELQEHGLLKKIKSGNKFVFILNDFDKIGNRTVS
ncbi:MAG: Fic family protein [Clostridiaceae bacterium]